MPDLKRSLFVWIPRALLVGGLVYIALPILTPHDHSHHGGDHGGHGLHAQNVYTHLTLPQEIAVFNTVSDGLICQCGCHFVLSSCPHVECPWGIPIRRFIETKIRAGASAEEILYKLEHGFGPQVRNEPFVRQLAAEGRTDLVNELERGYGPKIKAHAANLPLIALVTLVALVAAWLGTFWYRRNRRRPATAADQAAKPEGAVADDVQKRLDELDR
jgi:hypothetical protein